MREALRRHLGPFLRTFVRRGHQIVKAGETLRRELGEDPIHLAGD